MGMDLNEMAVFVAVARAGSFTAAADQLAMPRSTVSRRIANLEARIDAQLLHRTTRSVRLTDIGAAFFERARHAVDEARAAEALVAGWGKRPYGSLRMTAPLTFEFLGSVVSAYLASYPDCRVDLVCTDRVVHLIAEGFDLAVRAGRLPDSTLRARRLGTIRRLLVAAPRYLRSRPAPDEPAELAAHDTIEFSGGSRERAMWTLHSAGRSVTLPLQPRLAVNDYALLRAAACAGLGIALLPAYVFESAPEGQLVPVLPAWSGAEIPVHAVFPGGRHTPPKVTAMLALLSQRFAPPQR